jgi:hypothetical protein
MLNGPTTQKPLHTTCAFGAYLGGPSGIARATDKGRAAFN